MGVSGQVGHSLGCHLTCLCLHFLLCEWGIIVPPAPCGWLDRQDLALGRGPFLTVSVQHPAPLTLKLSYPKPSILLSPSGVVPLGGAVTVQCWGWHWHWHWYQNMRFLLYKDGNPNMLQDVEPRWDLADFLIRNVSWRDAGSYGCYYYSHWNPLIWSHPSDPVELVVAGELPGSVSPLPCRCGARRLFLYKGGMEIQELDAAGDGGEFTIPSARWEDGGAYSCRSHSRSEPPDWSYPSDTVWIIVAGERPSSASRPSGDVALGGAVTVQCRGRHQNVRFLLYKDGNPNALQNTEPAGNVAEFPIHSVSQRHAGSYSCYYYSHWNPPVWSHPSDPVELVVAGEGPGNCPGQMGTYGPPAPGKWRVCVWGCWAEQFRGTLGIGSRGLCGTTCGLTPEEKGQAGSSGLGWPVCVWQLPVCIRCPCTRLGGAGPAPPCYAPLPLAGPSLWGPTPLRHAPLPPGGPQICLALGTQKVNLAMPWGASEQGTQNAELSLVLFPEGEPTQPSLDLSPLSPRSPATPGNWWVQMRGPAQYPHSQPHPHLDA
uniref:Ig-like domain-containing protein n=1 Tax=Chrysemys picta bellii TaxID=8478 RepID=A0A8C3FZH6_CHRPI